MKGIITALITPFDEHHKLDEQSFKKMVTRQINSGINGLVPCGSTGEAATLSLEEHIKLVTITKELAPNIPVIAGASSNSTSKAIELAKECEKVGADAILTVVPYYNKPTSKGIYEHYKAIANAINIPIIAYNNPGRTVVNMDNTTLINIASIDNIIGIKEDIGMNLDRLLLVKDKIKKDFIVLSGDDINLIAGNAHGGDGVISVASNLIPKELLAIQESWQKKDLDKALNLHKRLTPLYKALFCETNPAPIKYAMSLAGLCTKNLRLPLVPMEEKNEDLVKKCLEELGLL